MNEIWLRYKITLKSDEGKRVVNIFAPSIGSAIESVLKSELAPERAIIKIEIFNK